MPDDTIPTPRRSRTDVLIAMSLDVRLTADQLVALGDDNTVQLFKAVKTVATLTETARTNAAEASR